MITDTPSADSVGTVVLAVLGGFLISAFVAWGLYERSWIRRRRAAAKAAHVPQSWPSLDD